MQQQKRLVCNRVDRLTGEMNCYIDYLCTDPCPYSRYLILSQLKCKVQELQFISSVTCVDENAAPLNSIQSISDHENFTLEELAKYNGKNGYPAYVAINGTVYDVTNNATWAAASHFGLSAGKDLSNELASCHAGQQILNKLKVVGKLTQ